MLSRLRQVDRPLLVINLVLLMAVVAIPFPTALVADNLGQARPPRAPGWRPWSTALVMILMSIAFSGMWVYLSVHQTS